MRESGQRRISLGGLDIASMESLMTYAYTSDVLISTSNVQRLLAAANLVEMSAVRRACCDFLERGLCPANCLGIHCFADAHACDRVAERALAFARAHFDDVATERELRELPQQKLVELIGSQQLNAIREEVVLQVRTCACGCVLPRAASDFTYKIPFVGHMFIDVRLFENDNSTVQ